MILRPAIDVTLMGLIDRENTGVMAHNEGYFQAKRKGIEIKGKIIEERKPQKKPLLKWTRFLASNAWEEASSLLCYANLSHVVADFETHQHQAERF